MEKRRCDPNNRINAEIIWKEQIERIEDEEEEEDSQAI